MTLVVAPLGDLMRGSENTAASAVGSQHSLRGHTEAQACGSSAVVQQRQEPRSRHQDRCTA